MDRREAISRCAGLRVSLEDLSMDMLDTER